MERGKGITEARELNRRREGCEWEGCVCSREATSAPSDVNTQRKILARRFAVSSCKTANFTSFSVVGFYCRLCDLLPLKNLVWSNLIGYLA